MRTLLLSLGVVVALQGLFYVVDLSKTPATIVATACACALYLVVEWRRAPRNVGCRLKPDRRVTRPARGLSADPDTASSGRMT